MAACCIGGVCIPYSAIVPFLVYCLKWLVGFVRKILGKEQGEETNDCCSGSSSVKATAADCCNKGADVKELESTDDFDKLVSSNETAIVKFTADWCRPCKQIQGFYEGLSAEHSYAAFATADADDLDDAASTCQVAVLPTFCAFYKGKLIAKYVGSNETTLRDWLDRLKEVVAN